MQNPYIPHSKKQLIIIQNIQQEQLQNLPHENVDILCIDIGSMFKLRNAGLPFITFYHYLNREEYVDKLKIKLKDLEIIFRHLDVRYAYESGYSKSFRGNFNLFLIYFSDYFFISEVVAILQNKYQSVSIYTSHTKQEMDHYESNMHINFFEPGTIYESRDILIALLIYRGLNSGIIYSEPEDTGNIVESSFYLSILMNTTKKLILKYIINILKNKIDLENKKNKGIIFSIDINYEPSYLLPFMKKYRFINPIKVTQKKILEKKEILPDILKIDDDLIKAIKNLTSLKDDILLIVLKNYQRDVISVIPSFMNEIDSMINEYKPVCILFSFGQLNILENIVAFLSNKHDIPVFNFQHGDDLEFINDELDLLRHNVLNPDVKKTWMLRSRKQHIFLNEKEHINNGLFHAGSIKIYNYVKNMPEIHRKSGKILIIVGHYPANAYKDLTCTETDNEIFDKHNHMLRILKKYDIKVDIKLFPHNKYLSYFKEMLRYYDLNNSKVIVQPSVEFMLPNYDMIIMEYFGSALTPLLMTLNVPIIYWINKSFINQNVLEDFCKRHYLITNETEFEEAIKRFKDNKLESKYDSELIKQYCFPSSTVDPAQCIAEYIKNHTFNSNNTNHRTNKI